jgi:hypothetical protein
MKKLHLETVSELLWNSLKKTDATGTPKRF